MSVTEAGTAPSGVAAPPGAPAAGQADRQSMNRTGQLLSAWCGPGMVILFILGAVVLAKYFPPSIAPGDSAEEVKQFYADNIDRIRLGIVPMCLAYALMCCWGVGMAAQVRRKEGVFPVWTYLMLVCMAAGTAQIVVNCGLWAAAAFRADDPAFSADVVQGLNDAGFIILLGTWMPFTLWAIFLGMAILLDKSGAPVFPRWTGYFSIFCGLCYVPGGTVWFFHDGAFGWQGAVCLYVPFLVFGAWVLYFSYLTYQNVKNGYVHEQELTPARA